MAAYDAGTSVGKYLLEADQALKTQLQLIKNYETLAKASAFKPPPVPAPVSSSGGGGGTSPVATQAAAERAILARAAAEARLAQAQNTGKNVLAGLTKAEQIYAEALAQVDQNSLAAIRTQTQLQTVQNKITNGGKPPVLPRTIDGLSGAAATAAKAFLTVQAAEKAFSLVRVGAQASDAKRALDGLAVSANTTGDAVLNGLRAAAQGTIRDSQLVKSAATGITLTNGLITKDLPQLVEIARAGARATSQDVGFVFDSLVRGISRGSALIIDNAGITLDAAAAYETYAKKVGTSVDNLTDQQRQQAVLNAVLLRGSDIVKQVGLEGDSAATNIDRAVTSVQNLGEALASKVAPFIGKSAGGLANLINTGTVAPDAADAGNQVQGSLVKKAQDYQTYVAGVDQANAELESSIGGVQGAYARLFFGLNTLTPAEFAYAQSLIATGTATDAAVVKAKALSPVLETIARAQERYRESAVTTAEGIDQFGAKLLDLSTGSVAGRLAVEGLTTSFRDHTITAEQFTAAVDAMIAARDRDIQATREQDHENRRLLGGTTEARNAALDFIGTIQASAQASALDAAQKDAQQAKIALLDKQNKQAVDTFLALNPTIDASAAASLAAADGYTPQIQQMITLAVEARNAKEALGGLNGTGVVTEGRAERDKPQDLAQARTAGLQLIREQAEAQRQAERDRINRIGTTAQKLALAQKDVAAATDPTARYQAQTRVLELQQQLAAEQLKTGKSHTSELNKQLGLQESIRDSQEKQLRAQLDAAAARIKDRQDRRKEDQEIAAAQRILNDPRKARLAGAAQDKIDLINIERQQRALDIANKTATAGGTIINGKLFQSVPGSGAGVVPVGNVPPGPVPIPTGAPAPTGAPTPVAGGFMIGDVFVTLDSVQIAAQVEIRLRGGLRQTRAAGGGARSG